MKYIYFSAIALVFFSEIAYSNSLSTLINCENKKQHSNQQELYQALNNVCSSPSMKLYEGNSIKSVLYSMNELDTIKEQFCFDLENNTEKVQDWINEPDSSASCFSELAYLKSSFEIYKKSKLDELLSRINQLKTKDSLHLGKELYSIHQAESLNPSGLDLPVDDSVNKWLYFSSKKERLEEEIHYGINKQNIIISSVAKIKVQTGLSKSESLEYCNAAIDNLGRDNNHVIPIEKLQKGNLIGDNKYLFLNSGYQVLNCSSKKGEFVLVSRATSKESDVLHNLYTYSSFVRELQTTPNINTYLTTALEKRDMERNRGLAKRFIMEINESCPSPSEHLKRGEDFREVFIRNIELIENIDSYIELIGKGDYEVRKLSAACLEEVKDIYSKLLIVQENIKSKFFNGIEGGNDPIVLDFRLGKEPPAPYINIKNIEKVSSSADIDLYKFQVALNTPPSIDSKLTVYIDSSNIQKAKVKAISLEYEGMINFAQCQKEKDLLYDKKRAAGYIQYNALENEFMKFLLKNDVMINSDNAFSMECSNFSRRITHVTNLEDSLNFLTVAKREFIKSNFN